MTLAATAADPPRSATGAAPLRFVEAGNGEYRFDTGILRGRLRAEGKSLGLSSVVHVPTGTRLDRSNGLFSHYRVFGHGKRYGGGAWDWPSTAKLREDGSVEVHWTEALTDGRPIEMTAVYQWSAPDTLELETVVKAHAELPRFEVFLASYFQTQFTNALVRAEAKSGFIRADPSSGDWQMFPRDQAAIDYITDGRWKLEPNPVEWTIRPRHTQAVALRRAPELGLAGILVAAPADCFAIAMPHETEGHYSVYLSLFGRDLGRGEIARARTGLIIAAGLSDSGIRERANAWLEGLARSRR